MKIYFYLKSKRTRGSNYQFVNLDLEKIIKKELSRATSMTESYLEDLKMEIDYSETVKDLVDKIKED